MMLDSMIIMDGENRCLIIQTEKVFVSPLLFSECLGRLDINSDVQPVYCAGVGAAGAVSAGRCMAQWLQRSRGSSEYSTHIIHIDYINNIYMY